MKKVILFSLSILFLASCSKPDAGFVANLTNSNGANNDISFTNKSVNSDSYLWQFGDGQSSTDLNPTHIYNKFGDIMIVLEASKGTAIDRDTQYINIPEPPRKKVKIETPYGNMIAELFNSTPLHRENFLKNATSNYYEDLLFHRVMKGFMIQGGDPDSRNAEPGAMLGMGGPGYVIQPEYGEPHYKGALAAARKPNDSESSGSQFYIVDGQPYNSIDLMNVAAQYKLTFTEEQKKVYQEIGGAPFLDMQYTVFGQIIEGLEVIDKITEVEVNSANRPLEDVKMKVSVINE